VVHPVPHAWGRRRLLGEDLAGEVHVEAPEVDQLARRVDLRLVGRLALPEHRRGVQRLPPRPGEQVGGLEEDGRAVVEGELRPAGCGFLGTADGLLGVAVRGVRRRPEDGGVPVRLDDLELLPRGHPLLPADGGGQVELLGGQLGQPRLQRRALGRARGVVQDRLVGGGRHLGDGVHGEDLDSGRQGQRGIRSG
jgi:hypothetical protein